MVSIENDSKQVPLGGGGGEELSDFSHLEDLSDRKGPDKKLGGEACTH